MLSSHQNHMNAPSTNQLTHPDVPAFKTEGNENPMKAGESASTNTDAEGNHNWSIITSHRNRPSAESSKALNNMQD